MFEKNNTALWVAEEGGEAPNTHEGQHGDGTQTHPNIDETKVWNEIKAI